MAKKKVVSCTPVSTGAKRKDGRKVRSGTVVTFNDGSSRTLLTPAGKGEKYAAELRNNQAYTNDFELKKDGLTKQQRAYRGGYLDAMKDSAKAFNAKKKGGK